VRRTDTDIPVLYVVGLNSVMGTVPSMLELPYHRLVQYRRPFPLSFRLADSNEGISNVSVVLAIKITSPVM
jgi:hypothetical protein